MSLLHILGRSFILILRLADIKLFWCFVCLKFNNSYIKDVAWCKLKMLGLYLVGQNCLHLTFEQYLNSETYSSKYEKLQNIVILACKNITEKSIC